MKKDSGLEKILKEGWKITKRHTRGYITLQKEGVEMIYNRKEDRIISVYKI